jgi:hypothetical protein
MLNSKTHPANPAISIELFTSYFGLATSSPRLIRLNKDDTSSFLCDFSKIAQLLLISLLPLLAHLPRSSILSSIFSIPTPSHSISLSGAQPQPHSHLMMSSFYPSERRSTVRPLTANLSDAPFAFSDAPTEGAHVHHRPVGLGETSSFSSIGDRYR